MSEPLNPLNTLPASEEEWVERRRTALELLHIPTPGPGDRMRCGGYALPERVIETNRREARFSDVAVGSRPCPECVTALMAE